MKKNAIVAGTGFDGRAKIIRKYCKDGMNVILKRDPSNKHDANAIAVSLKIPIFFGLFGKRFKDIGFIKASTAKNLAKKIDAGVTIKAKVSSFYAPHNMDFPRVSIEITDEIE